MLMCPAAFLRGTGAEDDAASVSQVLYLLENDYCIICMQTLPEVNKQEN